MNTLRHNAPAVALVLALFLGISSLLPFWTGGAAEAAAPAGAGHATMHHHSSADAGSPEPSFSGSCPQHESCVGKCCAGCVQCVMNLSESPGIPIAMVPEFRATVFRLTLDVSASLLDRPPRG